VYRYVIVVFIVKVHVVIVMFCNISGCAAVKFQF
jgi:hypothetical protein